MVVAIWIAILYPLPPQLVMIFIWLHTYPPAASVIQKGTSDSGIKNQHNAIPSLAQELACD